MVLLPGIDNRLVTGHLDVEHPFPEGLFVVSLRPRGLIQDLGIVHTRPSTVPLAGSATPCPPVDRLPGSVGKGQRCQWDRGIVVRVGP